MVKKRSDLVKIKDIKAYRGFYQHNIKTDQWYKDSSYNFPYDKAWRSGYSIGFEFTHGVNKTEHLYNKLKKNIPLSKNERIEFDDYIGAVNIHKQMMGIWYDFRAVLHKVPVIYAWVIDYKK